MCYSFIFSTYISQLVRGSELMIFFDHKRSYCMPLSSHHHQFIFKRWYASLRAYTSVFSHTCSVQYILFLLCLSHSVGLQSKHVVTAFGSSSLNRCQLLEVSLSAWSALNIEITTLQPMNTELVQSSLFLNY